MKKNNREIDLIIEKRKSPKYRKQFIIDENNNIFEEDKNVYQ